MNTANLQLEGLYLVIAAVHSTLVAKGILTREELDQTLRQAEAAAIGDDRMVEDMSPANRDAVAFPARLLALANKVESDGAHPGFAELARLVATTKQPYNDQR